tara:strand:- start:205 stop:396 length:192 start_codon:yes stop_codon:yes gene_type:complete
MSDAQRKALEQIIGKARRARLKDELDEEETEGVPGFMISIGLGPSPEMLEALEEEAEEDEEKE